MRRMVIFLAINCILPGCSDRKEPPDPLSTPAQVFDEKQGGKTVTPYGKVVQGSAEDGADGSIQYKTEDGSAWKVKQRPDGTYGIPEKVK